MFQSTIIVNPDPIIRKKHYEDLLKNYHIHTTDVLVIDTDPIGIEEVRNAITYIYRKPFASEFKSVIVEADYLSDVAQQALLKLLEEPPHYALIVLASSTAERLLPTIISRCFITTLSTPVGTEIDSDTEAQENFWKNFLSSNIGLRLKTITQFATDRTEVEQWLTEQISFFRPLLLSAYTKNSKYLITMQFTPLQLTLILRELSQALRYANTNVSLKLLLDHLALNLPKTVSS